MTVAPDIRIAPVGPDRAAEVAQVLRTSFQATYPDFPQLHSLESQTNFVGTILMTRARVEAALAGDRLVGVVAYSDDDLDQLYILPDWQGQGIGGRLLQRAQEQAERLTLWTFQVNRRARAFYARHGFREIAFTEGDNEEGQPDVQMEWRRP